MTDVAPLIEHSTRPASEPSTPASLAAALAAELAPARAHTLELVAPLSTADLHEQHDPLMSPIIWDLGHIAHFEELWLTRNLDGPIEFVEMPGLYNPFEHPRRERGTLALPGLAEVRRAMEAIRGRVLERLARADFSRGPALLTGGYVYRMVLQHEYQHCETILQTLQLKRGAPYAPASRCRLPAGSPPAPEGAMVRVPGGEIAIGTDDHTAAYDNERPRHPVALEPYWMDVTPVTNGAYLAFIDAGGYRRREWWSDAGWRWLTGAAVSAPKHWESSHGEWTTRTMDLVRPLDPARPVCHVSYWEAEAYARFAGKRLPTESEWEAAAAWDPASGTVRPYPWGDEPPTPEHANLGQRAFDTAPVGAYPRGRSAVGCYGMLGDVWEWTSSDFTGYPGFASWPYREYSEVFFGGEYKVLRGGSWATQPGAVRNTFRNWDYPIRRQIFSGFRCARDA
ncbi:MAG TPA: ergothioneine biosynthesis protein EgtB [Gemmatimonadales bacterium]|nr:ergothioneine biosynthesis protein EgtB [Gemmatimonadales bacterium]